jgi:putative addiction module component (TIGR02574 family)
MAIRPELRDELRRLPAEDRQELAEALYDSLLNDSVDPEWEKAWGDEVQRRVQDVVNGNVQLLDADDVHAELRQELQNAKK